VPDAVVVGSGPNGLAAAFVLASAGLSVTVYEAAPTPGGGCRTEELTLPGFRHDVCSAVHPLAAGSGFFQRYDVPAHGVRLLKPPVAFAHPLGGGRSAVVTGSVEETAGRLGSDASTYTSLMRPLVDHADGIVDSVLSTMRAVPSDVAGAALFARLGLQSVSHLARRFQGVEARALVSGVGAHSIRPLDRAGTGGVALLLSLLAHSVGWPIVEGGSQAITDSLVAAVTQLGGEVVPDVTVRRLEELPDARLVMLDTSPSSLLTLAGDRLPSGYARRLSRYRYGPGVCKVDWALSEPVPWSSAECRRAGTVHVGGDSYEVARAESEVCHGRHPAQPFVLCTQPGVVDATRAPSGRHTLWTYCHVPSGSDRDMSAQIASQIERFAPGFSDVVLAKSVETAADCADRNPNYVGGDIACGVQDLRQTFGRPVWRWDPYRTPLRGVYLCSSATPPGPGGHGRCGELAALSALRHELGIRRPPELAPGMRRLHERRPA
jgi:phytoene dehydrogenase-like protein